MIQRRFAELALQLTVFMLALLHLGQACTCGQAQSNRLYYGSKTSQGQYPWLAVLMTDYGYQYTQCDASMISTRYALTAGHCVTGPAYQSTLYVGIYNLNDITRDNSYSVDKFISKGSDDGNDIALVKLESSVTFGQNIQPICLPPDGYTFAGDKVTMIGYGKTQSGDSSNVPRAGDVTVPTNTKCSQVNRQYGGSGVVSSDICAGNYGGGPAMCDGDSGGPLMYYNNGKWTIIGVVSGSYSCDSTDSYGIYTRVSSFTSWIQSTTDNAGCQA